MNGILVSIFVLCLFEATNAYCCFRGPLVVSPTYDCPDFYTPCGLATYPNSCANTGISSYGCNTPTCPNIDANFCGGSPCMGSCYRDTANVCSVCDKPSPICACLKTMNNFDCGCEEMRSFIYFPEVEYPTMVLEMQPFYYSSCMRY